MLAEFGRRFLGEVQTHRHIIIENRGFCGAFPDAQKRYIFKNESIFCIASAMDAEGLKTFLAICRAGGFSNAAGVLHRSQPAVSRRIALLEEELGAPLFERGAAGIRLSTAGKVLVPHAEKVMAALEDCRTAIAELQAGRSGPIELAAVGTLAGSDLTRILGHFVKAHPDVGLTLRTATSRQVSGLVRSGDVTLGLRYQADPSVDVDCEQVAIEKLVVVCRPDHPRSTKSGLRLLDLAEETWLVFPDAASHEATSDNIFAHFLTRGYSAVRSTEIDSLTAQKRLVEAGLGIALLPESAIVEEQAAGRIATISVSDLSAFNPVCLITRRGGYLSPAVQTLIGLFRSMEKIEAGAMARNGHSRNKLKR